MVPLERFPEDAIQHADEGIEIKGSRYLRGWQGHNPESTWLMVFMFDSIKNINPKPFRFVAVFGAQLTKDDWQFSGRSETSDEQLLPALLNLVMRKC